MSEIIHTTTDAIDAKGLQSRSLRGQQAVIDAKLHEDLKGALLVLLRHHNDWTGLCCPGQDLIAAKLGVTENTVRARLRKIEQRGLVTIHRTGRWTRYTIHFEAIDALEPAAVPVDNSLDTLNRRPRHPQNTPSTPANHEADTLKLCALTDKGTGYSTEEGTEPQAQADNATAATPAEIALPPLLDLESLKTETPAPIADLVTTPPAAPAAERAVAIDPETLAAVNAQRATHGKGALRRDDLAELGRQATLAGMSPQAAAEWVLAKTTRSFFKAEWLTRTDAPAARDDSAKKVPLMPGKQIFPTYLHAKLFGNVNDQRNRNGLPNIEDNDLWRLENEAKRAGISVWEACEWILADPSRSYFRSEEYSPKTSRPATTAVVLPPSAALISARPTPQRTVTVRSAAPVSVGAATGIGWARTAVQRFIDGQAVSHATITSAASALGLPLADLKAQRTAHLAAVAV